MWGEGYALTSGGGNQIEGTAFSVCVHCREFSFWVGERLIFPLSSPAPKPNSDLTAEIQEDFNEARDIVTHSPRGAAALLRLCIQKLCSHLGEGGKNVNNDIGELVKKGLPLKIQQALDTVRVVGNNAVHPGQIDLKDDVDTANALFHLVNLIAEVMISQPKQVEALYQDLVPLAQQEAILRRDAT
jgi:hypothetical protein